jgi:hypothetical protein
MMRRLLPWALVLVSAAVVLVPLAYVAASIVGLTVVRDTSGEVVSAVLTNGGAWKQPMAHLPFGVFVGLADSDGEILLHCHGGRRSQFGYVTPGMIVNETVEGGR